MSQNYLDMQFGTVFNFLVDNNCWDYLKYDLKRDEVQIIAIIKIFSNFKNIALEMYNIVFVRKDPLYCMSRK